MTSIEARPAKAGDFPEFFGRPAPRAIRATSFERAGKVVGMAGYYMAGDFAVVFSDVAEDVPKMTIWRAAKRYMAGLRVPATCTSTETSGPFLERLGWQYIGPSAEGPLYRFIPGEGKANA